jgi:hypothetical protein
MSTAPVRSLLRGTLRLCLPIAIFGSIFLASASAQIVPTLSPPVFSVPLYQNPFDFPGSVPLAPPIGTPIAASDDALSPSSVTEVRNRVDPASTTPSGIAGIDTPTSTVAQPGISNEQLTAPRLEQLTTPALEPSTLIDEQRATPKIKQLTLPSNDSPGVGAQPLSQIRTAPQVLGSQRLNALPPNQIELTRSQLSRQGAWSMAGSRRTTPLRLEPAELPVPHAIARESSTYAKLDPLSPEVLASGFDLRTRATGGPIGTLMALRNAPANSFAFHPKPITDLHAQPTKRPRPSSLKTPTQHPGVQLPSLRSNSLLRSHSATSRPNLETHPMLDR